MQTQVLFKAHPHGLPTPADFEVKTSPLPTLTEGKEEVLVKNYWLSIDPYMRGRMNPGRSYAEHMTLGDVMVGGTVGKVIESNTDSVKVGTWVSAYKGWQSHVVLPAEGLKVLDVEGTEPQTYLYALGAPGFTAYYGLMGIGKPKEGETILVTAAGGAVGSLVGQFAKQKGLKVIGIAGGPDKCARVVKENGFDACVDYKSESFAEDLKAIAKDGIDIYFDNVGGAITELSLGLMNDFGRVIVCGQISQYNNKNIGESYGIRSFPFILTKRLTVEGFIVGEKPSLAYYADFIKEVKEWTAAGKLHWNETITEGLENSVDGFLKMLQGQKIGKALVRIAKD
eukprot:TRINITY_DN549_c0_g1_i1.p1 TRINITY_DN549_c0_g1~~TRINITY_DN549_c0_g1_i1.p1  ORF type:complete len:340 (-),score=103.95 TRINITY_DN549_c0_g1_i1:249-1268(-)